MKLLLGGKYYTIVNNTAICGVGIAGSDLGGWKYFLIMSDLSGSKVVNNFVKGGPTGYQNQKAIAGNPHTLQVNEGNYFYHTSDSNSTGKDPLVDYLGRPNNPHSPLIDSGHSYEYTPRDDYDGSYNALGNRDIGAYEIDGFDFTNSSYYSLNLSGNVVAEYGKGEELKYTNIYGAGLIGQETYTPCGAYANSYYYIKNHLGSTMKVVRDDSVSVDKIQYYDYGERVESVPGSINGNDLTETFTGKTFEEDGKGQKLGINGQGLGMYYFGARYYDPQLGQWISQDPAHQFANPYGYGGNGKNVVVYVDKDGRFFFLIPILIGATMGAYQGYKIGEAAGAKGWGLFAYSLGGAAIGGVASYTGIAIAQSGGLLANTISLAASSTMQSAGFNALSGGKTDFTTSFGAFSVNWSKGGDISTFSTKNSWQQNLGYTFGALANVADAVQIGGAIKENWGNQKAQMEQSGQDLYYKEGYAKPGENLAGDNFTGSNNANPFEVQPSNTRDLSSYGHDLDYDALGIKGEQGMFTSREAIPADLKLMSGFGKAFAQDPSFVNFATTSFMAWNISAKLFGYEWARFYGQ